LKAKKQLSEKYAIRNEELKQRWLTMILPNLKQKFRL
jgi:hypothetical protein